MADFLTHLCLPLTVVYVLRRDRFPSPVYLLLGGFGVLSDLDKFLGRPGLLHSLLTLVPLVAAIILIERWWRGESVYGPIIAVLVLSHLLLDIVDGGPVPLLYPAITEGIGLQYPARTVFGTGPLGVTTEGPLVALRTTAPRGGFNTYGFINGFGVMSLLVFVSVYVGLHLRAATDA